MKEKKYIADKVTIYEDYIKPLNLTILSASPMAGAQTGLEFYREVKGYHKKGNLWAVSLELDSNLQPFINLASRRKNKISYQEFPILAYTMDYCIKNKIVLFASDPLQQQSFRKKSEMFDLWYKASWKNPTFCSEFILPVNKFEKIRAKETAERLRRLSPTSPWQIIHIASRRQAKLLEKLLG